MQAKLRLKTQKLLEARGYAIQNVDSKAFLWQCIDSQGQPVHVQIIFENLNLSFAKSLTQDIDSATAAKTSYVYIVHKLPAHHAHNWLSKFRQRISILTMHEVMNDPTQHHLYDPHVRTPREALSLHVKHTHLPKLSREDAVVRYFGWQPGDVIHISCRRILNIPAHDEYRLIV